MNKAPLTRAVQKALDNGWDDPFGIVQNKLPQKDGTPTECLNGWSGEHGFLSVVVKKPWWWPGARFEYDIYQINEFMFNHQWYDPKNKYHWNFAYHIWGDDWKRHVQQMVISDDPIAYLGEHLE